MKAAKLEKSARLQRLLEVFTGCRGEWLSTWQVQILGRTCATSTGICELRRNGVNIESKREGGIWLYRMR